MGNHEEFFLYWLKHPVEDMFYLSDLDYLKTVRSFIPKKEFTEIMTNAERELPDQDAYFIKLSKAAIEYIENHHEKLLSWLRHLPYYYETDKQIFVHAGIDEEAGEYWKIGTYQAMFASKFPATTGRFHKDIIAGHVHTSTIANDRDFHEVYWDGENHYFIDGNAPKSGLIPVLKYDTETERYTSFRKVKKPNSNKSEWEEYLITNRE
jgi:serine/threonine protein phosphatase 1